jgi:hypothetical protein
MPRRKITHRSKCTFEGCKETGWYEFSNQREYRLAYERLKAWRCVRHTRPEEVLTEDAQVRTGTLVATRVKAAFGDGYLDGLFWKGDGRAAGSGLTYGPGFKAYASDFPEGTRLTVVARVDFPEADLGLPTEEDTKGRHGPIGVLGTDVGAFIKCSCGKNPTPKIWLEEHWAGDPETGKQLVRQFLPASEDTKGEGS